MPSRYLPSQSCRRLAGLVMFARNDECGTRSTVPRPLNVIMRQPRLGRELSVFQPRLRTHAYSFENTPRQSRLERVPYRNRKLVYLYQGRLKSRVRPHHEPPRFIETLSLHSKCESPLAISQHKWVRLV